MVLQARRAVRSPLSFFRGVPTPGGSSRRASRRGALDRPLAGVGRGLEPDVRLELDHPGDEFQRRAVAVDDEDADFAHGPRLPAARLDLATVSGTAALTGPRSVLARAK